MILNDHPKYIEEFIRDDMDYPKRLTLEVTSYCNLRCWMCPKTAGFVNTLPNHLIEEDVIHEVRKILPHIEILQLSGLWGEIFLHPEVYLKILKLAKEADCTVSSISNGTLLTTEVAEQVVTLGLDHLTISIDAATSKTYQVIRVGGNFKKLIKNLKKLQKIKKKKGVSKPELRLAFVGMKRNIRELPEVVNLASKLGIQNVILQGMGEYKNTEGESLTYRHRELGKEIYEKAAAMGREKGVHVTLFPPDQFDASSVHATPIRGALEEAWEIPEGYRKDCDMPWEEVVVTTTGDVLPCCAATKPFGNILKTDFSKIWLSSEYRDFRRRVMSSDPPLMCKACTGVGWKKVTETADCFKMGLTDDQLGLGWYPLEKNGAWGTYRWTGPHASLFLRNNDKFKNLAMTIRIADLPKEGEVIVNGYRIGGFSLRESRWETLSFPLPRQTKGDELLKVEIRVKNPSSEGEDKRTLGVALTEVFLS